MFDFLCGLKLSDEFGVSQIVGNLSTNVPRRVLKAVLSSFVKDCERI